MYDIMKVSNSGIFARSISSHRVNTNGGAKEGLHEYAPAGNTAVKVFDFKIPV